MARSITPTAIPPSELEILRTKLKTLRRNPVNDGARGYNAALDEVEKIIISLLPPPVALPNENEANDNATIDEPVRPELQTEWDSKVHTWADSHDGSITFDRALTKLAPHAKPGSAVRKAIESALGRLPRDRYAINWYMNGDHLARSWAKVEPKKKR